MKAQPTGSETAPSHFPRSAKALHGLSPQIHARAPTNILPDVLGFYPDTQLALRLWKVYVKSVDPVLKILHIPTVQSTVVATILDPISAQSSTVALTFAIYYAAVTALCDDENNEPIDLPWEKPVLLNSYGTALDRLLNVPDLTNRPDMPAIQALAIYVVSTLADRGTEPIKYSCSVVRFNGLTTSVLDLLTGSQGWPECLGPQRACDPPRTIDWLAPRWCLLTTDSFRDRNASSPLVAPMCT